jgi:HEPN domain-containing protein
MSNPTDPLTWVDKAEEDYKLAQLSLRRKQPLTYGATYHAQQCGEKYPKALLVDRSLIPPRTHDLVALSNQCVYAGIMVPVSTADLQRLSDYAIQSRYPGNDPTTAEAKDALTIAKAVRKFARKLLSL